MTGTGLQTYHSKVPNPTDPSQATGTCTIAETPAPAGGLLLTQDPDPQPQKEPGVSVVLRPFDRLVLTATCTGGLASSSSVDAWPGDDPEQFDAGFFLPSLAINQGKVIQNVAQSPGQATYARCPGKSDSTTACTMSWSGTVTLDLVEVIKLSDDGGDVIVPLPPGGGADEGLIVPLPPGGGSGSAHPPLDGDLIVPLPPRIAPRSAALSRDGGTASVALTCTAACAGTVTAYAAQGGRARSAAAARALGKRAFRLPAGRRGTVKIVLRGAARRAARRAGGVRLVVRTAAGTATVTARRR